jgi:hypothetical protein
VWTLASARLSVLHRLTDVIDSSWQYSSDYRQALAAWNGSAQKQPAEAEDEEEGELSRRLN